MPAAPVPGASWFSFIPPSPQLSPMLARHRARIFAWCFIGGAAAYVSAQDAPPVTSPAYLDRFTGTYRHQSVETMTITRVGEALHADAGSGRPTAQLVPQSTPGAFLMRNDDFEFRFIADANGNVAALDIVDGRGHRLRLQRQVDAATSTAVRAVAVNAATSVLARVFNNYERRRDPHGQLVVETYAFSEGGFQRSSPVADASIDDMSFERLAQMIAPAMKAQRYEPATTAETADLVVMIYWGATTTDEHPAVIAQETYDPLNHTFRGQINRENARLLGFDGALDELANVSSAAGVTRRQELFDDLEESRYWIALVAVDYQAALREEQVRPVWSVRYSIRSRRTTFDAAAPQMSDFASRYFGRDSGGLINPSTDQPNAKVDIGELQVVDD